MFLAHPIATTLTLSTIALLDDLVNLGDPEVTTFASLKAFSRIAHSHIVKSLHERVEFELGQLEDVLGEGAGWREVVKLN
jgi:hypothetical protein